MSRDRAGLRRLYAFAWTSGLAALLGAVLLATAANARTFRAADIQSEDYPTVQALMHMDRLLQERTGGRHRPQIFHFRQLGAGEETSEPTRGGAIDPHRLNLAPNAGLAPGGNVLRPPVNTEKRRG